MDDLFSMKIATQIAPNVYGYIAIGILAVALVLYIWRYRRGQKNAEQDQAGREPQGERIPTSEETISSVSSCPEENKKDRYGLFSHLGGM